jgi:chromate transport protein ChrA
MIVLGAILLVIGFIVGLPLVWTIGVVLILAGLVLALVGRTHPVGGRAHWY